MDDDKKQQVLALGRLGWSLRRIEAGDGRPPRDGERVPEGGRASPVRGPGRPATASWPPKPATTAEVSTDSASKPATTAEVSTDSRRRRRVARAAPRVPARASRIREVIEEALGAAAATRWRSGRTWSTTTAFTARYASVKRFVRKLRGSAPAEARVVITTAPGEEGQVDYGDGPMVRDPQTGKYRRTRLFVLTLGLLAQVGAAARVALEHADLGRAARAAPSGGWAARCSVVVLDNLREGVLTPGHLRPDAQSALPRRARALRRRRAAVPRRRSRSQGQGRVGRRPRAEDAAQGAALRDAWRRRRRISIAGRSTGPTPASTARPSARSPRCLPRSSPRCGPLPARALPLLPLRRAHGAPRRLRRGRGRLLRRAARLDRPAGAGAVGRPARAAAATRRRASCCASICRTPRGWHRIQDEDRPARTPRTHRRRCSRARATAGPHIGTRLRRTSTSTRARPASAASWACSPSPRSTAPAAVDDAAKAALELGVPDLPLPPPLPRTPAAGAADACARSTRSSASSPSTAISSIARQETRMNLVELDHALRKLRLSGMADVLETRLRQAQTETPRAHRPRLHARLATSCCAARTGSSSAATSRPASATPTARSTASTSTSTRR